MHSSYRTKVPKEESRATAWLLGAAMSKEWGGQDAGDPAGTTELSIML